MRAVEAQGLTLVSLHDRPSGTALGEYVYLIELSGGSPAVFEQLAAECGELELRCLGCYRITAGS